MGPVGEARSPSQQRFLGSGQREEAEPRNIWEIIPTEFGGCSWTGMRRKHLPSLSVKPRSGGQAWDQDSRRKQRGLGELWLCTPWVQIPAATLTSWAAWWSDLTSLSLSVHTGKVVITTAYSSRGFRRAGWDNPDNEEQAWRPWKRKCHIYLANDPQQPSALQPVTSLSASEDTWKDEVPRPSLTTQASLIRDWEEAQMALWAQSPSVPTAVSLPGHPWPAPRREAKPPLHALAAQTPGPGRRLQPGRHWDSGDETWPKDLGRMAWETVWNEDKTLKVTYFFNKYIHMYTFGHIFLSI